MRESASEPPSPSRGIVSRETELRAIHRFFTDGAVGACLALSGPAGIGKTTLWEAGLDIARSLSIRVLAARTSRAEVALAFATVADLVDGMDDDVLGSLPEPQRAALEVALRLRAPTEATPDPFAVSAGFLSAVREQSRRGPLLIAIDDVQSLDPSSLATLGFAARRLDRSDAKLLITVRSEDAGQPEIALHPVDVEVVDVVPLSFGATQRVLLDRLGESLDRRDIRQVYETSQGNPLFALELGRALLAGEVPVVGSRLPTPEIADEVFGERIRRLSPEVRRALLVLALDRGMTREELLSVVDPHALEDAISAGLVVVDRAGPRPAHPMLAAAIRGQSSAKERHDLHRDVSVATRDETLRAHHLALASSRADAEVASVVAAGAELASRRGAILAAAELGEHALRLTPEGDPAIADRLLALGRFYLRADRLEQVTSLLAQRLEEIPRGRSRAIAHLLLGEASDIDDNERHIQLALTESEDDAEVRAYALAKQSRLVAVAGARQVHEAEALAMAALETAQAVGPAAVDSARASLVWTWIMGGRALDTVEPSQRDLRRVVDIPGGWTDRALATRHAFRGEMHEARTFFAQALTEAEARGDVLLSRVLQQQLCEVELRAGNANRAARLVAELDLEPPWMEKIHGRLQTVLAALTGDVAGAARWSRVVLDVTAGPAQGWDRLEVTRALGVVALLQADATAAAHHLQSVWEHTIREQIDDPGAFPVAADLVESLVQGGHSIKANEVSKRLRHLAKTQRHPWATVSAERCAASIKLAAGDLSASTKALQAASGEYGVLGMRFDQARTLLFLGSYQRRFKQRGDARHSLALALDQFDQAGCVGWAARARSELQRVSGRRAANEIELTPSERQVADLAISGLSNKEIAARLFVSVSTVEVHLTHAYAKLGVRSRSQLAGRLSTTAE